ncbi:MAG: hypothetical protein AAB019_05925 [Planctomycetota bacterium]
MEVQPDFKELLKLFNVHKVEYIIVGGYAVAFHGAPRYTGDIDLFIKAARENARCVLKALVDFGFGSLELTESDFSKSEQVIQLGVPPVRIDLITSLTGVTWDQAEANKESGYYGDVPVFYIGR